MQPFKIICFGVHGTPVFLFRFPDFSYPSLRPLYDEGLRTKLPSARATLLRELKPSLITTRVCNPCLIRHHAAHYSTSSTSSWGKLSLSLTYVDSITRIRFAHNDSHRLAIASADGTASICYISESKGEETAIPHKINYLEPPVSDTTPPTTLTPPPAALMDVAWSLANDFVATVSLDASLCLWDVQRQGCLTRQFRDVASPGGGLLVCEFHPVNNNYLALGDTLGLVQVCAFSLGCTAHLL